MDMISKLPDHIQHQILNFLDQPEISRAAILSRSWRITVQSHPVLTFNQSLFKQTHRRVRGNPDPEHFRVFSKLIDESLRTKIVLKKFSLLLQFHALDLWHSQLDSWIEQLVRVGVEELLLGSGAGMGVQRTAVYALPKSIFCSNTLTKLCLKSWYGFDLKHCCSVNLPNLLDLKLQTIFMRDGMMKNFISGCPNLVSLTLQRHSLKEHVLKGFISGCPNLESLEISVCFGISNICVSDLARLHIVKLSGSKCATFSRVKIVAPRLRVFKFSVESKSVTDIELLACEFTLRVLWLCGVLVTEETLRSDVSRFRELEELVLQRLHVKRIEILNKRIRELKVSFCYELEKVEIDASKLEVLAYYDNKLPFYSLNSDSSLKKFDAWFPLRKRFLNKFPSWVDSFKGLFLSVSRFKDIKLILKFGKNVIVCEDLDERLINMLTDMRGGQPFLEVMRIGTYEHMMNELFKQHFQKIVFISLVSRRQENHTKFLQVLKSNALKQDEEPNCCRYGPNKCWKHFLCRVKLICEEMIEASYLFQSYDDTAKCEITHTKLYWID